MKKVLSPTFWVTNTSKSNVTLADLAINIPAFRTVNLMDSKHYSYTLEQLKKSAESGSIFKKRNKIQVRQDCPEIPAGKYIDLKNIKESILVNHNTNIPSRERSTLIIKEEKYEELQISDEDFASENAETAEMDTLKPVVLTKG